MSPWLSFLTPGFLGWGLGLCPPQCAVTALVGEVLKNQAAEKCLLSSEECVVAILEVVVCSSRLQSDVSSDL